MGGCKEGKNTCTNKTCKGYEVDIMHFSIGNAIPGRLYGGDTVDVGNEGDEYMKLSSHHFHTYKAARAHNFLK